VSIAIVILASLVLLAALLLPAAKRVVAVREDRERQQEHLEHQAMELEEQAVELELQVEELEKANAALIASEAATAIAHREAVEAMAERLRQTALFEAAVRTVPIAMAIIDRGLRYVKVNAACAAMTGLPVDAHPGRTLREVNPLFAPELEAAMRRVLETGEPCINYRLSRPTPQARGGVLEIVMHITAFRDIDGTILGICSTATDVSEWKALQDQFFQAQKLEAVGMLAAGIAHDFNNLLTVISSYCDLVLMEMPQRAPHRQEIGEIRSAAGRASTLARRMLGMARSHALVITPIELREVVAEARALLVHAVKKNIRLEVTCADEPGVVLADPTHVEQILVNLVVNAVDAMPDGGAITVRTRDVTLRRAEVARTGEVAAGDYVELTVSDTGNGMDETTLARIFEPFFTTKPRGKGTGLGLATVFGIVRDLRGGVQVDSAPWKGTTFRLLFPRLIAEEGTEPRRVRKEAAVRPRGHETLLLVEDEDALRASMARVFTRQGYRVLEASHGGEALRVMAADEKIALVVSDLEMPGVGGRELSERIHALGHDVPVLFMSGSGDGGESVDDIPRVDGSHDRFISKPFEVETLLTTVREMLEPV
jgi:two-component system cell cycle sensor histidine kinase/response regulator CckA